jgi:ubiquinone biosynthesis protein UbiJ
MRIDNTRRPAAAAGVGSYQKASTTAASAPASRATDAASVLGIPQSELTPKVQEAIAQLMAEVDTLRQELDQSMSRIEYLVVSFRRKSPAKMARYRAPVAASRVPSV